ncbi:MAG: hypothetical protein MJB57_09440, partial [Gemmatimonadetes bacterium]|nr:hypothetical protein [Gemmatimonadota bacterium]
ISFEAFDDLGAVGNGIVNYFLKTPMVDVTPDAGIVVHDTNQSVVDTFTVKNTGNATATYDLTHTCTGTGITGCSIASPSPPQVTLAPDATAEAVVAYQTLQSGPALIELTATDANDPAADTGRITVTFPGSLLPNRTPNFDRSMCLTANLSGVISQCGDLIVTHALPSTRTFNQVRTPTLIYNSWTVEPFPIVSSHVLLPVGYAVPDSMQAVLKLGGTVKKTLRWDGSEWTAGATRRITIGYRDGTLSTGVHDFILEVSPVYGTQVDPAIVTDTIPLPVVNRRSGAPYGRGWWVAGLEKLVFDPSDGSYFWIGGDGSTRLFEPVGTDLWATAAFDRPDTLKKVGSELIRELRGGSRVVFDATGRHIRTVNRLGHTTEFTYYSATHLHKIKLPVPAGAPAREYTFTYHAGGGAGGKLISVEAPPVGTASRTTTFTHTSGPGLGRITDPDGGETDFATAWGPLRITRIEGRDGVRTTLSYHSKTQKLLSARRHMVSNTSNDASDIVTTQVTHDAQTWSPTSMTPEAAYTLIDGPRLTPVSDTTAFHIDYQFGAPRVIANAVADSTKITRGGSEFPSLVTQVERANGHVVTASYNARGNVETVMDQFTGGTTSYEYNNADWPDFVTKVVPPSVTNFIEMDYDATTGNRIWQQDARGSGSRANFRYYSTGDHAGMLRAVQAPLNSGTETDSVTYDPNLGNLQTTFGPTGARSDVFYDAVGQVTTRHFEIDSLVVPRIENTFYDIMGRDTLVQQVGPPMPMVPVGEAINVTKEYDPAGRLESVMRDWAPKDDVGIDALTTTFVYDRAGRVVAEIDAHGEKDSTVYDLAGNIIESRPRHLSAGAITMQYDDLNRLTQRNVPSVHYDGRDQGLSLLDNLPGIPNDSNSTYPSYPTPGAANNGYDTPADTETFTYDEVGNVLTANNWAAKVTRTWNQNGTLAREILDIAEVLDTTFNTHVYQTDYTYDVAGRLEKIKHPSVLAPGSGVYETEYAYDPDTGGMSQVTDPDGNSYSYTYDLAGRIDKAILNGVEELFDYYPDGALERHRTNLTSTGVVPVREDAFTYDLQGRLVGSSGSFGTEDQYEAHYSGLGYVVRTELDSDAIGIAGNDLNYRLVEEFTYDGLGSLRTASDSMHIISTGSGGGGGSQTIFRTRSHDFYLPPVGGEQDNNSRLKQITTSDKVTTYEYDLGGNQSFIEGRPINPTSNTGSYDDRATWYNALGQIASAERRTMVNRDPIPNGLYTRTQDDYRYDALGRRVLVRTRQYCENHPAGFQHGCSVDWVRRTVWDGDRELWEVQMPDATFSGIDMRELDVGYGTSGYDDAASPNGPWVDNNPYFGRVAYTYGARGVDQPIAVHRYDYTDHPDVGGLKTWASTTNQLLWNFRGQVDNSRYVDGSTLVCDPVQQGRCIKEAWPAGMFAYDRVGLDYLGFWQGSLSKDKRDATGTHYRRNRYYDPASGQFTQEDPIGLAGGLNLYGFAG